MQSNSPCVGRGGGVGGGLGGVMTDLATGEDNLLATFDIYLALEREKR